MSLMKPVAETGIVGYGSYVPQYRLTAAEIARVWRDRAGGKPIKEKAVPGQDEDTITIGIKAARNAVARAKIDPEAIGAVWCGSESHPFAVKPSGTYIAQAIGATPETLAGDWEFACKAGTEAMQASIGFFAGGMARYALCIGADTAQGRPGDALEFTAAAGGAAFVIGSAGESVAVFDATYSYVSETPDFWRRPITHFPSHGQRFTGEPGYFHHVMSVAKTMMAELGRTPKDFDYVVLHQPNQKFPERAAKMLGFEKGQWETGLLSPVVGNTYSGASLLGLAAVLDIAKPGEKILCVSFGSGAGSDAFSIRVTDAIVEKQKLAPATQDYINRRIEIDYATYARYREKLKMH